MTGVSIIMPAYNGVATIGKAVESLQKQTCADLEILIVDDQSTDGTYEFLQKMAAQDSRIHLLRTPQNSGPSIARQIALDRVTGDWITLCDADDWYEPERVEKLLEAAVKYQADVVIDNLIIFDHAIGKVAKRTNFTSDRKVLELSAQDLFRLDNPLHPDSIGYSKPFMRAAFLREHKIGYWGKYRTNEDFIILAEMVLSGAKTFVLPEAYYVYKHRISPTTRKVSPHSHSADDTAHIVAQACDDLLEKYGAVISGSARQELLHRKKIFLTSKIAWDQTEYIFRGQYGAAMRLFIRHPALWMYRLTGIRNHICRMLGIA